MRGLPLFELTLLVRLLCPCCLTDNEREGQMTDRPADLAWVVKVCKGVYYLLTAAVFTHLLHPHGCLLLMLLQPFLPNALTLWRGSAVYCGGVYFSLLHRHNVQKSRIPSGFAS